MEVPPDVVARFRLIEPIADIPALRVCFGTGGLQWFPPSTEFFPSVEQIVDIPVPHRGYPGDLQGFHTGQGSTARPEQNVDIPVPRGGLQDFRPGQVSTASSSFSRSADEAFEGFFFALFREEKSAEVYRARSVRSWVRTPAHPR